MTHHRRRAMRLSVLGAAALLALGTVGGTTAQSPSPSEAPASPAASGGVASPGPSGLVGSPAPSVAPATPLPSLSPTDGQGVVVGIVTHTATDPADVALIAGAQAATSQWGSTLSTRSGDDQAIVKALESLVEETVDGILITPGDPAVIGAAVDVARASGPLVIALGTNSYPTDGIDGTIAADERVAGSVAGQWAAAAMGDGAAGARIALLDQADGQGALDIQRGQGFLEGFGIDVVDPAVVGDETDARIAGHAATGGTVEGGRTALEGLLGVDPAIDVVFAVDEASAAGAHEAIAAAGLEDQVLLVSVGGSCDGVEAVKAGAIAATAMLFPERMAEAGVEAIIRNANTGALPQPNEGLAILDTGSTLITDRPTAGIDSQDSTWGLERCWGREIVTPSPSPAPSASAAPSAPASSAPSTAPGSPSPSAAPSPSSVPSTPSTAPGSPSPSAAP